MKPPPIDPTIGTDKVKRFLPPECPTGGTSYSRQDPMPIDWFLRAPNGGGTVYQPFDSGNPYARIDEDPSPPRPVVVVELPEYEEGQK